MSIEEIIETLEDGTWWDYLLDDIAEGDNRNLCDAIDAAIALLKTHPDNQPNEQQGDGWISVKNPPDLGGGRYLVWTDNNGTEICRWSEDRKRWIGGAWTQHITHWRPMPKPPKEETT